MNGFTLLLKTSSSAMTSLDALGFHMNNTWMGWGPSANSCSLWQVNQAHHLLLWIKFYWHTVAATHSHHLWWLSCCGFDRKQFPAVSGSWKYLLSLQEKFAAPGPTQGQGGLPKKIREQTGMHAFMLSCFSHVWFSVIQWTITCSLSMGFSRQE